MELLKEKSDRELAILHFVFVIAAIVTLVFPMPVSYGTRLLVLVVFYNVLIPVMAKQREQKEWMDIWQFSFVLSLFMIFPDWFLAKQLETLVFPIDTLMIDVVPAYMAGFWAIPFFIIIYIGNRIGEWQSGRVQLLIIAIMSLVIFGMAEATLWPISWSAQNVLAIGGVLAVYIIIPEIILGLAVFVIYAQVINRPFWYKVHWSYLTMLLYLGSATFFYFMIEGIILPIFAG